MWFCNETLLPPSHQCEGTPLASDPPTMSIDDDCALGHAQALTYLVYTDHSLQGWLQPVECCAYPGTGRWRGMT